jgi:DNA-binding NarL/FixJ family response regulator
MSSDDQQITILVAEDNEIMRIGIVYALEKNPRCKVIGQSANGLAAIDDATRLKPDVVLMDARMPIMSGIEATCKIRQAFPTMKVLMLTAANDDETILAALSSGADGYCLKQGPVAHIAQAVLMTASGGSWLDPGVAMRILRNSRTEGSASAINIAKRGAKDDKYRLSPREFDVLLWLVEGLSNRQIAEKLCVSSETVKTHLRHIMEKLQVADRTQAAVKAVNEGLVEQSGSRPTIRLP